MMSRLDVVRAGLVEILYKVYMYLLKNCYDMVTTSSIYHTIVLIKCQVLISPLCPSADIRRPCT